MRGNTNAFVKNVHGGGNQGLCPSLEGKKREKEQERPTKSLKVCLGGYFVKKAAKKKNSEKKGFGRKRVLLTEKYLKNSIPTEKLKKGRRDFKKIKTRRVDPRGAGLRGGGGTKDTF